MENLSPLQLLKLWSELEQAYYSDNGYGGSTAEIYSYTLMSDIPSRVLNPHNNVHVTLAQIAAARSLVRVCRLFCQMRDAYITIDDRPIADWDDSRAFEHRAHVTVYRTYMEYEEAVAKPVEAHDD